MNRATILIASGATVALMLAGTYAMASERATTMAQLSLEAAKAQASPAKAGIVLQTTPTAALPTRAPAPRASESVVDVIYHAEPSDAEILVPYRSIEAETEAPEPEIAFELPVPDVTVTAREAAPRAAPAAAIPQAAPPPVAQPAPEAQPAPAAQPARAVQPAPQPAPVQPRVTPPPQPPEQEQHEVEHHEEHHEDHPEEHHVEDHH
jgi:hypothetical protein